jgi:hypothetical protein
VVTVVMDFKNSMREVPEKHISTPVSMRTEVKKSLNCIPWRHSHAFVYGEMVITVCYSWQQLT